MAFDIMILYFASIGLIGMFGSLSIDWMDKKL